MGSFWKQFVAEEYVLLQGMKLSAKHGIKNATINSPCDRMEKIQQIPIAHVQTVFYNSPVFEQFNITTCTTYQITEKQG